MSERENVARMIRFLALFVLIPTLTIGAALLWDPQSRNEHWLHAAAFASLAVASLAAMGLAPRLAQRFVPDTA